MSESSSDTRDMFSAFGRRLCILCAVARRSNRPTIVRAACFRHANLLSWKLLHWEIQKRHDGNARVETFQGPRWSAAPPIRRAHLPVAYGIDALTCSLPAPTRRIGKLPSPSPAPCSFRRPVSHSPRVVVIRGHALIDPHETTRGWPTKTTTAALDAQKDVRHA